MALFVRNGGSRQTGQAAPPQRNIHKGLGKIGYVANSPYTVAGETMSAGRLYDKIGKKAKAKIVYVIPGGAVCKIMAETEKHVICDETEDADVEEIDE